jgi:hypothetical protein
MHKSKPAIVLSVEWPGLLWSSPEWVPGLSGCQDRAAHRYCWCGLFWVGGHSGAVVAGGSAGLVFSASNDRRWRAAERRGIMRQVGRDRNISPMNFYRIESGHDDLRHLAAQTGIDQAMEASPTALPFGTTIGAGCVPGCPRGGRDPPLEVVAGISGLPNAVNTAGLISRRRDRSNTESWNGRVDLECITSCFVSKVRIVTT